MTATCKGGMNCRKRSFSVQPASKACLSTERRPRRVRRLEIALQLAWSVCERAAPNGKIDRLAEASLVAPYSIYPKEEIGSGPNSCSGPDKISHLTNMHEIRNEIKRSRQRSFSPCNSFVYQPPCTRRCDLTVFDGRTYRFPSQPSFSYTHPDGVLS
jgi:hypothetical protein